MLFFVLPACTCIYSACIHILILPIHFKILYDFLLTCSPTLQGSSVTSLEARRIVLKMLAVSSTHSKMQNELSNERALSLLADVVCSDPSHENLTNGLITLANVAQNVTSHELVRSSMR